MNEKVLHTLEYHKIRERLASHCFSDKAKERAIRLSPKADLDKINLLLDETDAATGRILKKGNPSFTNPKDVIALAKRLEIGGVLNIPELLSVSSLLNCTLRIKTYGQPEREDSPRDCLSDYFENLSPLTNLKGEIDRCILSEEEIADDASPALYDIRRKIRSGSSSIQERMQKLLNSLREYLTDAVITQRGGRYCLPVAAGHKAKVPGMVHDQSGSGATLFIEPMSVVELNNKLKELYLAEEEEIEVILKNLSGLVGENTEAIISNYKILTSLDFIFGKGKLALEMNALRPKIKDNGFVNLKSARHPLIDPHKCVPIDIRLGENFNLLIITGPNTGGKTVSIKTLGLLCLMAQSGLLIPAKDGSTLPLFYYIGADIGDEQSIEQSLSTFSSHMTNIKRIMADMESDKRPSDHCLVLFDELCAGTDPSEGAALATAILDDLSHRGVRVMATTHYSELKVYALTSPLAENASMEFSLETLSPTYRLIIGAPGKSNAFAISSKLGISGSIIDDAKKRMSESDVSVEELLADLEMRRIEIEKARQEIVSDREKIAALKETIRKKEAGIEKQKNDILEKANQKASNILKDAKDTADAAIRNINKYGSREGDLSRLEKDRANLGKKLKSTQSKSVSSEKTPKPSGKGLDPKSIRVGDRVHVISLNLEGIIQSLPGDKNDVEVRMGIMNTRVPLSDLIAVSEPKDSLSGFKPRAASSSMSSESYSRAMTISPEIKLIGMTADEAILSLSKYLDDAYLAGLNPVRIVHGKGSGILRKAVADYLRKHPLIKDFHIAEYGEGDAGVTIANFK